MDMVRFLFLCVVMALASLAAACSGGGDYDVPAKQAPALWLIEDPESGERAYIMGSVHMLPDGLDWVTPKLRKAAAESDILITEIGGQSASIQLINAMATDEAVPPLAQRLDETAFARAELLASGGGVSEEYLDKTESWSTALILTQAQSADLGVTTAFGVEDQLRDLMVGKPVIALETAKTQLERFDTLPNTAQDNLLYQSLQSTDPRAEFQAMLTAWLTGDFEALEGQLAEGWMADATLRDALLHRPNTIWAEKIAVQIRAGKRPFVAIGTAHLLGEQSVLALLQAQGMVVTRIQ